MANSMLPGLLGALPLKLVAWHVATLPQKDIDRPLQNLLDRSR